MSLFDEAGQYIRRAKKIADIGPGIRPQSFFKADTHICVEPHEEYADWLEEQGFPVIRETALLALPDLPKVESIFMLDVIEHMEKPEGLECVRLAREKADQVVLFTPLGFCEQSYKPGEKDAWGMNGSYWQTHRSGWTPDEFAGARLLVDLSFHGSRGGAFFAIYE